MSAAIGLIWWRSLGGSYQPWGRVDNGNYPLQKHLQENLFQTSTCKWRDDTRLPPGGVNFAPGCGASISFEGLHCHYLHTSCADGRAVKFSYIPRRSPEVSNLKGKHLVVVPGQYCRTFQVSSYCCLCTQLLLFVYAVTAVCVCSYYCLCTQLLLYAVTVVCVRCDCILCTQLLLYAVTVVCVRITVCVRSYCCTQLLMVTMQMLKLYPCLNLCWYS